MDSSSKDKAVPAGVFLARKMGNHHSFASERRRRDIPQILLTPAQDSREMPLTKRSWAGFSSRSPSRSLTVHSSPFRRTSGSPSAFQNALEGLRKVSLRRGSTSKRFSDFGDIAYLAEAEEGVKLTPHQQKLIQEAWQLNKKSMEPGLWIFQQLFFNNPDIQGFFGLPLVSCPSIRKLQEDAKFFAHCTKFSNVLEMCVDSVEALDDSVGPLLVSYGSKHAHLNLTMEHWQGIAEAMCEYAGHWKLKKHRVETIQAWRILIFFVTSKVHQGYLLEKGQLEAPVRRNSASSAPNSMAEVNKSEDRNRSTDDLPSRLPKDI